ncbi:MAG TPA: winged helix-turn-helix domain-containing protein [Mycobacteriales bacterium]|nr:winged helix-turn-helix domain-containing protein [Mycobacteriales bacterium]
MPEPAPPVTADLTPPLGAGFPDRAAEAGVDVRGALSAGELTVDLDTYTVTLAGRELGLSPRQVELLALFVAAPRRVWSRTQLHWVIWGDTAPSRRVDVQLCRLRARTGVDLFRNVRDRGWTLRAVA